MLFHALLLLRRSFLRRLRASSLSQYSAVFFLCSALLAQTTQAQTATSLRPDGRSQPTTTVTQGSSQELPTLSATERELKGGETHSYRIQLTSGQFLYALVEQKDIDVVTATFGPDGNQINESDSPNDRWGTEPILLVASTSGTYRVDVRSPNAKAPAGRYEIKMIALREATPIDKGHATAEIAFDQGRKLRAQQTAAARRQAIDKYGEALPLFKAAEDSYRQGLTLLSIGICYLQLNEFRKALDYFNETLT